VLTLNFYRRIADFINCTIEDKKYERYVTQNDIYDATKVCPTCGSSARRKSVCLIQIEPLVEFLYCQNCKGCSASSMPTDAYLKDYYVDYYKDSEKQITFYGQVERFSRHIYKYLIIDKNKSLIKIMDFGGGDGSIAVQLGRIIMKNNPNIRKIHVLSVDYQVQNQFDDGTVEFHSVKNLDEVDCTYDVIIASAIFEHIQNLDKCLVKIFSLITSGGYLYARTPFLMPFKKLFNVPLLYPMHVHDLGPSFWNRIIERYNLDATMVSSRPPLAETEFKERFAYTLLGYLFKLPCFIEKFLRKNRPDLLWQYVAGWEIVVKVK